MERRDVEELYVRFAPLVAARARRLLRDEQAAQDAVHDIFVRVLRTTSEFRDQASPATWLYRITTNHCLNCLRDANRREVLWSHHGPAGEATEDGDGAARIQLRQLLTRVRVDLQEIALYHVVDELSQDEIAGLLGVSRRTIGNRLQEFRAISAEVLGLEESL